MGGARVVLARPVGWGKAVLFTSRALTPIISRRGSLPRTMLQFLPLPAQVPSQLLLNHPQPQCKSTVPPSRPGPRGEGPRGEPS